MKPNRAGRISPKRGKRPRRPQGPPPSQEGRKGGRASAPGERGNPCATLGAVVPDPFTLLKVRLRPQNILNYFNILIRLSRVKSNPSRSAAAGGAAFAEASQRLSGSAAAERRRGVSGIPAGDPVRHDRDIGGKERRPGARKDPSGRPVRISGQALRSRQGRRSPQRGGEKDAPAAPGAASQEGREGGRASAPGERGLFKAPRGRRSPRRAGGADRRGGGAPFNSARNRPRCG